MATESPAPPSLDQIKESRDIGPALLGKLAELVPPAVIAEKIMEMLDAEMKNARGEYYPDWRAREAGIKLYLSYQLGMPVQRQIVVNEQRENTSQTLERLLASPASRRALQAVLDEDQTTGNPLRGAGKVGEGVLEVHLEA